MLIGAEQERPYERPPLSKGFLLGKDDKSKIYVHEESWYQQHDVDLRRGVAAVAVDRGARQISLAGGEIVRYDKLLFTTGASPRRRTCRVVISTACCTCARWAIPSGLWTRSAPLAGQADG